MWPVPVVVRDVVSEDVVEVPPVQDQYAVEALAAARSHPTLRVVVRVRRVGCANSIREPDRDARSVDLQV